MRALKVLAVASVLAAGMNMQAFAAAPLKIRADWSVLPGQFAPLIPSVPKYDSHVYRHYGKTYVVEPIKLTGGGGTLTALGVGETDLSTFSPQTLVDGVVNAKLDLRVIAEQIVTEMPGYAQTYFWGKKDKIKTVDDLKGKVIGVNALGSNTDAAARIVMARHGFVTPRDYTEAEIPFPFQLAALKAGKIDAAVLVPPFSFGAEADPQLKPIFSVGDAFGGAVETLMWVAKASYIKEHRAALVDFLEDNIRMRRWMFNPKTRMEAVRQMSNVSKIPLGKLKGWLYTHKDYYYPPDAMVDVKRLQRNIDDMAKVGVIPKRINVTPYVDLSLVKEAAARVSK